MHREKEDVEVSRKEIVLLVSRALALPQIVYAFVDATSIPEHVIWLMYRLKSHSVLERPSLAGEPEFYSLVLNIVRLIIISTAAILFWRCGPVIARWLLPESETPVENSPLSQSL
jgi:hypothetical protein